MTQTANSEAQWLTPSGTLTFARDGTIRAHVRLSPRTKTATAQAAEAAASLQEAPFLAAGGLTHGDDGVTLAWKPAKPCIPLATAATAWRREAVLYLPQALEAARTVSRAASILHGRRPSRFLLSPLQVLAGAVEGQPFSIAPLPLEGGLLEAAGASPASVAWLPGDEILRAGGAADRAYTIGAVLYYCLVDELYPPGLPLQQRMQRMLLYRGGNEAWTKAALTAAMPASLAPAGLELASFIMMLLGPEYGRPVTPLQAARELDRFSAELSAPRLAVAWDAEGAHITALKILNAFEKTAPKNEVPWELLARLRAQAGDTAGEETARRNVPQRQNEGASAFIASLRKLIEEGPAGLAGLQAAAGRLAPRKANGSSNGSSNGLAGRSKQPQQSTALPPLSDEEQLFLIYVNARYLHNADDSLKLLNRAYPVAWRRLVRAVLKARLHAEKLRWRDVSAACAEGLKLIVEMPNKGSEPGRYAGAYLQLLDGAAHLRTVQSGLLTPDYLQDAFLRLQNGWSLSREAGAGLEPHIASWMGALAREASRTPKLAVLTLGIEAFLHSVNAGGAAAGAAAALEIPWFDDKRLFT